MFRAFFDESGLNPREDKVLIMAGFLGHAAVWAEASGAWDACLHESPRIEYFSHREAQSLTREFRGWPRQRADDKVLALTGVISKFDLRGFCAGVPYGVLSSREQRISRKVMGSRFYDWGFLAAVKAVLQYMQKVHPSEQVNFIFDERNELTACIASYHEWKQNAQLDDELIRYAGQCVPGTDKDYPALQMADLLAWECSKVAKTELPTDPFDVIADNNGILTINCQPPPLLNATLELGKLGQDVQKAAADILRRLYGQNERSPDLATDTLGLVQQAAYFNIALKRLESIYERDEGYQRFTAQRKAEASEG
jgi:hypothetical protein